MLNLINFYFIVVGSPTGVASGPITSGTRDVVPGMNMIVLNSGK